MSLADEGGYDTALEQPETATVDQEDSQTLLTAIDDDEQSASIATTNTDAIHRLCRLTHSELTNLGSSLTCPICQSCVKSPVITPCVHAFCEECLVQHLSIQRSEGKTTSCPSCRKPCPRRGHVPCPLLTELVVAYKRLMQSLGWTPAVYSEHVQMTQLPPNMSFEQDDGTQQRIADMHHQLMASKTWDRIMQQTAEYSDVLRNERHQVLAVNERAMIQAAVSKQRRSSGSSCSTRREKTSGECDTNKTVTADENQQKEIPHSSNNSRKSVSFSNQCLQSNHSETLEEAVMESLPYESDMTADASLPRDESLEERLNQALGTVIRKALTNTAVPCADQDNTVHSDSSESPTHQASYSLQTDGTAMTTEDSLPRDESLEERLNQALAKVVGVAANTVDTAVKEAATCKELPTKQDSYTLQKHSTAIMTNTSIPRQETLTAQSQSVEDDEEVYFPNNDHDDEPAATKDEEELNQKLAAEVTTTARLPTTRTNAAAPAPLSVGDIVHVQPRTWPGINKPGGVARIIRIHCCGDGVATGCDVAYVLGGKEKRVSPCFILPAMDSNIGSVVLADRTPNTAPQTTYATGKRSNRRHRATQEEIPLSVLQALAAEGFDTSGASRQTTNQRRGGITSSAVSRVSNSRCDPRTQQKQRNNVGKENEKQASTQTKRKKEPAMSTTVMTKKSKKIERSTSAGAEVLTREEASCVAKKRYISILEKAMENENVIHVVASSLNDVQKSALNKLIENTKKSDVKLKVSDSFHPKKTNLVIVPASDEAGHVARTRSLKVMRASLAGIPMVTPRWISHCLDAKQLQLPSTFIRTLPSKRNELSEEAIDGGVALLAARWHQGSIGESKRILPLDRTHVCLVGSFVNPPRNDIFLLLKESGATHVSSVGAAFRLAKSAGFARNTEKLLVFLCDGQAVLTDEIEAFMHQHPKQVATVSTNWLFDSISCGEQLPTTLYQVQRKSILDESMAF